MLFSCISLFSFFFSITQAGPADIWLRRRQTPPVCPTNLHPVEQCVSIPTQAVCDASYSSTSSLLCKWITNSKPNVKILTLGTPCSAKKTAASCLSSAESQKVDGMSFTFCCEWSSKSCSTSTQLCQDACHQDTSSMCTPIKDAAVNSINETSSTQQMESSTTSVASTSTHIEKAVSTTTTAIMMTTTSTSISAAATPSPSIAKRKCPTIHGHGSCAQIKTKNICIGSFNKKTKVLCEWHTQTSTCVEGSESCV